MRKTATGKGRMEIGATSATQISRSGTINGHLILDNDLTKYSNPSLQAAEYTKQNTADDGEDIVMGSKKLNSTLNLTRKVTTPPKVINFSADLTDALLASYDAKLVAYYS